MFFVLHLFKSAALSTNIGEVRLPIRTLWGLLVRKSNIQLQSVVLKPRLLSFSVSYMSEMILNAELKTTNSILMSLFLFSRCVKTEWKAVGTASSVDLLVLKAYWRGSMIIIRIKIIFSGVFSRCLGVYEQITWLEIYELCAVHAPKSNLVQIWSANASHLSKFCEKQMHPYTMHKTMPGDVV